MQKELNIFLTDDDQVDHEFFIDTVMDMHTNCKVYSFYNGVELMNALNNEHNENIIENKLPDLIVLDLNMPLLDGYEVLTKIKSNSRLKNISIFVLARSEFDYDKIKAIAYGANHSFTKSPTKAGFKEILNIMFTTILSHNCKQLQT